MIDVDPAGNPRELVSRDPTELVIRDESLQKWNGDLQTLGDSPDPSVLRLSVCKDKLGLKVKRLERQARS